VFSRGELELLPKGFKEVAEIVNVAAIEVEYP
jgi:hypothetical protein